MKLGQALKDIRVKNGIKQFQAAEKIGITQAYLSKIESDEKEPSLGLIREIGEYYDIPVAIILWLSLDEFDISFEKRALFKQVKPLVDSLINQLN